MDTNDLNFTRDRISESFADSDNLLLLECENPVEYSFLHDVQFLGTSKWEDKFVLHTTAKQAHRVGFGQVTTSKNISGNFDFLIKEPEKARRHRRWTAVPYCWVEEISAYSVKFCWMEQGGAIGSYESTNSSIVARCQQDISMVISSSLIGDVNNNYTCRYDESKVKETAIKYGLQKDIHYGSSYMATVFRRVMASGRTLNWQELETDFMVCPEHKFKGNYKPYRKAASFKVRMTPLTAVLRKNLDSLDFNKWMPGADRDKVLATGLINLVDPFNPFSIFVLYKVSIRAIDHDLIIKRMMRQDELEEDLRTRTA